MDEKLFCPLLNNECKEDACMMFVISNGVRLGCSFNVMAKQLDKLAYYNKPKRQESEVIH